MVLLGIAIALVALQVTRMLHHEVTLRLRVARAIREDLSSLELAVKTSGDEEIVTHVIFRFDAEHPAPEELVHTCRLRSGAYALDFAILRSGQPPRRVTRTLDVSGSALTTLSLP